MTASPVPVGMSREYPWGSLHGVLRRALESDLPSVGRLAYARTSVKFRIQGRPEAATLLLDRTPPAVARADEPAEIEIQLSPHQAEAFVAGNLPMPIAIFNGAVSAVGPVRKYLEVDPILRHLLGQDSRPMPVPGSNGHHPKAAKDAPAIDPALLAIETRDLWKTLEGKPVLAGVDLAIPEGVISVILGHSGAGKSVLLQHVIGLMRPDAGEVLVRGRPLSRMSRSEILAMKREVGVMFQDGALFSTMSVYENVAFPLRQHTDLDDDEIREVVHDRLVGVGLAELKDKMPNELSAGMRNRVGLARSLVLGPGIVLCDEPDPGLDPMRTSLLGKLLMEQHASHGGTMLIATNNVDLATLIGDQISVLWNGRILATGGTEEILESDTPFAQQFLTDDVVGPLEMDAR